MSERAQTADPITLERQRRDSWAPTVKLSSVMTIVVLLVTLGTLVWTMGVLVNSKADKETVNLIRIDVEVIKNRQQWFIDALKPGLIEGKE